LLVEPFDDGKFNSFFKKFYQRLTTFDDCKHLTPKFSYALKDLAHHFGLLQNLPASDVSSVFSYYRLMDEERTVKGPESAREISEKSALIKLNNTIRIPKLIERPIVHSRRSSDLLVRVPIHRRQYNIPFASPNSKSCYKRQLKTLSNNETKSYSTQWSNTRLKTSAIIKKSTVSAERSRYTSKEYIDKYVNVYLKKRYRDKKEKYSK